MLPPDAITLAAELRYDALCHCRRLLPLSRCYDVAAVFYADTCHIPPAAMSCYAALRQPRFRC